MGSVMVKSRTLNAGQSMAHYEKKLYSRLIFHAINILFFVQIHSFHILQNIVCVQHASKHTTTQKLGSKFFNIILSVYTS